MKDVHEFRKTLLRNFLINSAAESKVVLYQQAGDAVQLAPYHSSFSAVFDEVTREIWDEFGVFIAVIVVSKTSGLPNEKMFTKLSNISGKPYSVSDWPKMLRDVHEIFKTPYLLREG